MQVQRVSSFFVPPNELLYAFGILPVKAKIKLETFPILIESILTHYKQNVNRLDCKNWIFYTLHKFDPSFLYINPINKYFSACYFQFSARKARSGEGIPPYYTGHSKQIVPKCGSRQSIPPCLLDILKRGSIIITDC